jgi:HEAT repeat protein
VSPFQDIARQAKGVMKALSRLLATLVLGVLGGAAARGKPTLPESSIPRDVPKDVGDQLVKLYSPDGPTRGYAAIKLARMGDRASPAVPFLVAMLGDDARLKIEERDRELPSGAREHWIYKLEREERTSPGREAAKALALIGESHLGLLHEALQDPNEKVRQHAALALGGIKSRESAPHLIPRLKDPIQEVRMQAAKALGRINDPSAVEPLIAALGDVDWHVREQAAWALGEARDRRAIEPLIDRLGDLVHVSEKAEKALNEIRDPRAFPLVVKKLQDPLPAARKVAARILGRLGDPRAVPHLIEALRDQVDVQYEALTALGRLSGEDAERLGPNPARWQRWWEGEQAGAALREHVEEKHVARLIATLRNETRWAYRARAARGLGRIGDPLAVEPLIAALYDKDPGVRREAIWALDDLRDPRAIERLLESLDDVEKSVREEAWRALQHITGQAFPIDDIKKWQEWWADNKYSILAAAKQEAADAAEAAQAGDSGDESTRSASGGTFLLVLGLAVALPVLGLVGLRIVRRPKVKGKPRAKRKRKARKRSA